MLAEGKRRNRSSKRPVRCVFYAVILGGLLAAVWGCGHYWARGQTDSWKLARNTPVRPVGGEIPRLLGNARYFKLAGRPQLALKELEEAFALEPGNPKVADLLARTYQELGQWDQARKVYQESLAKNYHPLVKNNFCFSYYQEGRYEEAEKCFRETLEQDPQNQAARNNLGLLWCRQGRLEEAHRLWQEALGKEGADWKLKEGLAALGKEVPATFARAPIPRAPISRSEPLPAPPATAVPALEAPEKPSPAPVVVADRQTGDSNKVAAAAPAEVRPTVPQNPPGPPLQEPAAPQAAAPVIPPQPTAVSRQEQGPAKPAASRVSQPATPANPAAARSPDSQLPLREPRSPVRTKPLRVEELVETSIEIRNGTRTRNFARKTRSRLDREGFTVAKIGNHIDFGAQKTMVLYRPGAARVAQTLGSRFFPGAEIKQSQKLKAGTDVKVILGKDLLNRPQMLAVLAKEKK